MTHERKDEARMKRKLKELAKVNATEVKVMKQIEGGFTMPNQGWPTSASIKNKNQ